MSNKIEYLDLTFEKHLIPNSEMVVITRLDLEKVCVMAFITMVLGYQLEKLFELTTVIENTRLALINQNTCALESTNMLFLTAIITVAVVYAIYIMVVLLLQYVVYGVPESLDDMFGVYGETRDEASDVATDGSAEGVSDGASAEGAIDGSNEYQGSFSAQTIVMDAKDINDVCSTPYVPPHRRNVNITKREIDALFATARGIKASQAQLVNKVHQLKDVLIDLQETIARSEAAVLAPVAAPVTPAALAAPADEEQYSEESEFADVHTHDRLSKIFERHQQRAAMHAST